METIKLVVVGNGDKTALLIAYTTSTYPEEYVPTVFDNYSSNIIVDGIQVTLNLHDTAGQENFDRLRPLSYVDADVFLVCFSIESELSFHNVSEKWVPEIQFHAPTVPFLLVGLNKEFRKGLNHCVAESVCMKLASDLKAEKYLECSAHTQEGLKNVFIEAARAVLRRRNSMRKSKGSVFSGIRNFFGGVTQTLGSSLNSRQEANHTKEVATKNSIKKVSSFKSLRADEETSYARNMYGSVDIDPSFTFHEALFDKQTEMDLINTNYVLALASALLQGKKPWGRSKIMIVGEGRAGKTALANSLAGRPFVETDSTIGIESQFSMQIDTAAASMTSTNVKRCWEDYQKPLKELEATLALMIQRQKEEFNQDTPVEEQNQVIGGFIDERVDHGLSEDIIVQQSIKNDVQTFVPIVAKIEQQEVQPDHYANMVPIVAAIASETDLTPSQRQEVDNPLSDRTILEPIDSELVLRYFGELKQQNAGSSSKDKLILSIYDFGGQDVFYGIHSFFLTRYGVYLLVFNMQWLCASAPSDVVAMSRQYLTFWLNSIIVHTLHDNGEVAPIFFVGTRKDLIVDPAEHQHISTRLYDWFSSSIAWPYVVENEAAIGANGRADLCFFPVDNVQGRNDPVMLKLMHKIEESILASSYVHIERPLTWLQTLDALNAQQKPYLSYETVIRCAEQCQVLIDAVPSMLRFLCEMGMLMWHDEGGLRDTIILDPIPSFVQPATTIICKHRPNTYDGTYHSLDVHRRVKKRHLSDWNALIEEGIASEELIEALLTEHQSEQSATRFQSPDWHVTKQLMMKYGLLVQLSSSTSTDGSNQTATSSYGDYSSTKDRQEGIINRVQYLVPSLLPDNDEKLSTSTLPIVNAASIMQDFFFAFEASNRLRSSSVVEISDCQRYGFLPNGLFERLIGKASTWSRNTSFSSISAHQLRACRRGYAQLSFGAQSFELRCLSHVNLLQVTLANGCRNPRAIHDRLVEMICEIINECMKSLQFFTMLRVDNNDANLLIRLRAVMNCAANNISFEGSSKSTSSSVTIPLSRLQSSYAAWIQSVMELDRFDMFLSYRWGRHDSRLVQQLFDRMTLHSVEQDGVKRQIDVFLDTKRLQSGRNFQENFIRALSQSTIIVLIVSLDAVSRLIDLSPEHAARIEDNLLLEWICALELVKRQQQQHGDDLKSCQVTRIMPLIIGSRSFISSIQQPTPVLCSNLFAEGDLNALPTAVPTATLAKAERLLLQYCGCPLSQEMATSTIKDIIEQLLKFMAVLAWEYSSEEQLLSHVAEQLTKDLNAEIERRISTHSSSSILATGEVSTVVELLSTGSRTYPPLIDLVNMIRSGLALDGSKNIQEVLQLAAANLTQKEQSTFNGLETTKEKAQFVAVSLGLV